MRITSDTAAGIAAEDGALPALPEGTLEFGTGPELLVLLHAAAQSPRAMTPLAKRLAREDRRILVPHLGPQPPGADPIGAYAAMAEACLTRPAVRRVLFGHSMGALAALVAAAGGAPHDALVLYEPIATSVLHADEPEDARLRRWDSDIVERMEAHLAAGAPEAGVACFIEAWNEVKWETLPEPARQRMTADAPELARLVRATTDFALSPTLPASLPAPITVLQGEASPPVTRRMSERLQAALPGGTLRILPGCGHMGPVLGAATVAAALEAALAG